jgi:hypothetical protein
MRNNVWNRVWNGVKQHTSEHEKKMKCPSSYSSVYPRANRNISSSLESSLRWRTIISLLLLSSSMTSGLANDPAGWSSGKFRMRNSRRWLISLISFWVCWRIHIGFGFGLWDEWEIEEGVCVSGGVCGDSIGRWKGVSKLELIIHWYNLSEDFFDRSLTIRACQGFTKLHSGRVRMDSGWRNLKNILLAIPPWTTSDPSWEASAW